MSKNYIEQFDQAFKQNLMEMAEIDCQAALPKEHIGSFSSQGVAVIIGITGKKFGRIILDTSYETAKILTERINQETCVEQHLIIDTMAELTNILSGHTITKVNNQEKGLGLMLTPPSIVYGDKIKIASPKIKPEILDYHTPFGEIRISIGFEGGR